MEEERKKLGRRLGSGVCSCDNKIDSLLGKKNDEK